MEYYLQLNGKGMVHHREVILLTVTQESLSAHDLQFPGQWLSLSLSLWEITGISYGNKSRPDAHSNQMGHTLPIRDSWP